MAKNKLRIDFSTHPPTATSKHLQPAGNRTTSTSARQPGLVLDRLPLQLDLDAFPDQPIELILDAGQLDVAQLGLGVHVNGHDLTSCQATVQYRLSIPTGKLVVGQNRIELSRPPLVVQQVAVEIPTGGDNDESGNKLGDMVFGITTGGGHGE